MKLSAKTKIKSLMLAVIMAVGLISAGGLGIVQASAGVNTPYDALNADGITCTVAPPTGGLNICTAANSNNTD